MSNLTDVENAELEQLQKKCLKNDGSPKANAAEGDLARLKALQEKRGPAPEPKVNEPKANESKKEPEKLLPLTDQELIDMKQLTARANNNKGYSFPAAEDMLRLSKLTARAKANKQI